MPYKYIGRSSKAVGKTLWEIVGNLKNYGVGRIILRNMQQIYPEPTFMKILKVETLPCPQPETPDDMRKVKVTVQRMFRGKLDPKPTVIEGVSYKPDYILVPKDEEYKYDLTKSKDDVKILPKYMEFPPVLKELLRRESEDGTVPKLEIVYNKSILKKSKVAADGEKPSFEVKIGLGKPVSPKLFEGVKLS